jgi:hypothetical protein
VQAAIDALEQLGTIAAAQAIPALNYLLNTTSNRAVKQHARAAVGRLTMQSVPGAEAEAMQAKLSQRLPLHEVRVSFIDGVGAQMIMLSWKRPDGLLKGVNLLYQDQWGIKDCYGTDEMDSDLWASLIEQMEGQGFGSFSVPIEYARSLVAEARAVNKRTRHRIPVAFSIWRPFIEDEEAQQKGASTPTTPTALEPIPLTPEVRQLAEQQGGELVGMKEFSSWLFEPFESLQPYINRYWTNFAFAEMSQNQDARGRRGRGRGQGRGNKDLSQEQLQFLEDAVSEAIKDLIDEQWRALYEARMRRQALLFQFAGRKKDASLVQAVAAALHPDSGISATEQPFLRAMMRVSIQQGPIRMLAAALEAGQFDRLPLSPFSLDED